MRGEMCGGGWGVGGGGGGEWGGGGEGWEHTGGGEHDGCLCCVFSRLRVTDSSPARVGRLVQPSHNPPGSTNQPRQVCVRAGLGSKSARTRVHCPGPEIMTSLHRGLIEEGGFGGIVTKETSCSEQIATFVLAQK